MSRFEFAWDARYRIVGAAFGVSPTNAWVEVDETELRVRYGLWRLRTALTNISSTQPTGRILHPGVTLTVADPAALKSLLETNR